MEDFGYQDLFSIRATSRRLNDFLAANSRRIARSALINSFGDKAAYIHLYPSRSNRGPTRDPLLHMVHRHSVVQNVVSDIVDYIQRKIYRITSPARKEQFAPQRRRIEQRLKPPAILLGHFFEELAYTLEQYPIPRSSLSDEWYQSVQRRILDTYPTEEILPMHHIYTLLMSLFGQKLRPPTYAGSVERRLRGWNREPADATDMAQVLLLGGLQEVSNIVRQPKYILRLDALESYLRKARPGEQKTHPLGEEHMAGAMDRLILRGTSSLMDHFARPASDRLVDEGIVPTHNAIPRAFSFIEVLVAESEGDVLFEDAPHERGSNNEQGNIASDGRTLTSEGRSTLDPPPIINTPPQASHAPARATYAPVMNLGGY